MAQLQPLNLKITGDANGLSAELGKAESRVQGFGGFMQGQSQALLGVFAGLGIAGVVKQGFDAAIAGVQAAIGAVQALVGELDKIADKQDVANKLGITFKELASLEFSLGELTGLDEGTINNAIQRLLVGLEEAKSGAGKTAEVLSRLGLDANQLAAAGPVNALKQIADATRQIQDPTEQLAIAYDLFGKNAAGLVNALRAGSGAIEESANFAAKWLGLSQEQVEAAAAASDSWGRIEVIFQGLVQLGAAELAPLLGVFVKEALALAESVGGLQPAMEGFVNSLAFAVGLAKDLYELMTLTLEAAGALSGGDLGGTLNIVREGLDFSSGRNLVDKLEGERREIRDQLAQAQIEAAARAAAESTKQDQRQQEQINKLDEAVKSIDRLRGAVEGQEVPAPVDLG